jgi:hypothetical protein
MGPLKVDYVSKNEREFPMSDASTQHRPPSHRYYATLIRSVALAPPAGRVVVIRVEVARDRDGEWSTYHTVQPVVTLRAHVEQIFAIDTDPDAPIPAEGATPEEMRGLGWVYLFERIRETPLVVNELGLFMPVEETGCYFVPTGRQSVRRGLFAGETA